MRTYFQCVFSSFFNILMLNYFIPCILLKWHHQNEQNGHPRTFYIELRMKPMGVGLNLAL